MKKKWIEGNNKKITKLGPVRLLVVTSRYIFLDFSFITTLILMALLLLMVYFFKLKIIIPFNVIFSGSITAISFSFAMMAAIKLIVTEPMLNFYAHDDYEHSNRKVNKIYVFFSPFLVSLISWGVVSLISLIALSVNINYSGKRIMDYVAVIFLSLVIYSILNVIQLMWTILRLTIQKAFKGIE
ncbi:hypothetical protein GHU05_01635 [Fructobacillus tropaeoli]|uniref:hypothetical protein n=1 Tax=Fructobacillus tropaeoli TaxID=709323 RepID=UPI001455EEB5|nr:hypothetical protein [Fructobacillus tropaeoli]NLS37634.1 hypothetical protein [Fructobacillus tropaeoli]